MKMKRTIAILTAVLMLVMPLAMSDTATMSVTVGNTAPTVDDVKINGADNPNVDPSAGTTVEVTIYAEVTDGNGWDDITDINCTVTGPGTVEGSPVALTLTQLDSDTANGTGTFDMDFYDAAGTYIVNCTAKDASLVEGIGQDTFNYQEKIALELDASSVAFPSVNPGQTTNVTGDTNIGTPDNATIQNYGNVRIDATISGTDLNDGGNTITVGNVDYQFTGLGFKTLTTNGTTETDLDLTAGSSSTTNVDFSLYVPIGTVSGSYNGTTTITAVSG